MKFYNSIFLNISSLICYLGFGTFFYWIKTNHYENIVNEGFASSFHFILLSICAICIILYVIEYIFIPDKYKIKIQFKNNIMKIFHIILLTIGLIILARPLSFFIAIIIELI